MKNNQTVNNIPLYVQEQTLKKCFPTSYTQRFEKKEFLSWKGKIRPSTLSNEYTILIKLQKKKIEVFVIEPKKLMLFSSETKLPHVYSTKKQILCLFYPDGKQWNRGKLIVNSIIPWTSEWLYFYEIWLITGEWLGGGTVHQKLNNT